MGQFSPRPLHVALARGDFPALGEARALIYLDSASSTLMPRGVIDVISDANARTTPTVHRGVHALAQHSTDAYEAARARVALFLHATADEIVFVRGTTEAINLVANAWARPRLQPGDELLVTELEHHSNLLPWQQVAAATSARLRVVPVDADGNLSLEEFAAHLGPRTRLCAFAHVSNVLGTELPVQAMANLAHTHGALVMVDGAQAAPHLRVDVAALGCDFYACSGHKLYGPSGIGMLWARREVLSSMEPYQTGGGIVTTVELPHVQYVDGPQRFEAGTPHVAGALGLSAALDYLQSWDVESRMRHESRVLAYAVKALGSIKGVHILGQADGSPRIAVLSFVVQGIHAHDVATIADASGVAVRSGHHCAQPLLRKIKVEATVRLSIGLYNDCDDVDALAAAIRKAQALFR